MKLQCLGLASLERTIARQRSRVRELREGDANTKYFHLKARGRRRRNHIVSIRNGTVTAFSHNDKADIFHDHFTSVMGCVEDEPRTATINLAALNVPSQDMPNLTAPFTEEEGMGCHQRTSIGPSTGP